MAITRKKGLSLSLGIPGLSIKMLNFLSTVTSPELQLLVKMKEKERERE